MKPRTKKTAPANSKAYRLCIDTDTMQKGDPIRVAFARAWIGGRGYVDFAYVWKQMPDEGIFFLDGADLIYRARIFKEQLAEGLIETEEDYQNRLDAHRLHRSLGSYVDDHADFASSVLGRPVKHLSALSQRERDKVRGKVPA